LRYCCSSIDVPFDTSRHCSTSHSPRCLRIAPFRKPPPTPRRPRCAIILITRLIDLSDISDDSNHDVSNKPPRYSSTGYADPDNGNCRRAPHLEHSFRGKSRLTVDSQHNQIGKSLTTDNSISFWNEYLDNQTSSLTQSYRHVRTRSQLAFQRQRPGRSARTPSSSSSCSPIIYASGRLGDRRWTRSRGNGKLSSCSLAASVDHAALTRSSRKDRNRLRSKRSQGVHLIPNPRSAQGDGRQVE
jgi:hypothetical protein